MSKFKGFLEKGEGGDDKRTGSPLTAPRSGGPAAVPERYREALRKSEAFAAPAAGSDAQFAILLDATASMHALIDDAKASIGAIVERMREQHRGPLRISFVAYRDYDVHAKLVEQGPLSDDIQELRTWLARVRVFGGGDVREAIEAPLAALLAEGSWTAVLLAGDAASHTPDELGRHGHAGGRTAREIAGDFGQRGIPIHTFVVGQDPETVADFRAIADASGGRTGFLDGSAAMRDMAVLAMLERLGGRSAVQRYMDRYQLTGNAAAFGRLLLGDRRSR